MKDACIGYNRLDGPDVTRAPAARFTPDATMVQGDFKDTGETPVIRDRIETKLEIP